MRFAHYRNHSNTASCSDGLRPEPTSKLLFPIFRDRSEHVSQSRNGGEIVFFGVFLPQCSQVWDCMGVGRTGTGVLGDQISHDGRNAKQMKLCLRGLRADHDGVENKEESSQELTAKRALGGPGC